jgi:peptide/nickel transport system ATP-binding protein
LPPGIAYRRRVVSIDGRDMLRLDEAGLRAAQGRLVCYVPQDPATALNPALSIRTTRPNAGRLSGVPKRGWPSSCRE